MKKLLFSFLCFAALCAACSSKSEEQVITAPQDSTKPKVQVEVIETSNVVTSDCSGFPDYLANCKPFYCEEPKETASGKIIYFKMVEKAAKEYCIYKDGTKTSDSLTQNLDCALTLEERLKLAAYFKTHIESGDKIKKESGTTAEGVKYDETLNGVPLENPLNTFLEEKVCVKNNP